MTSRSAIAAALAVCLAVGLGACGPAPSSSPSGVSPAPTTAPSGTPQPPPAVLLAEIRAAISELRGLQPTTAVEPVIIDEATLQRNLEAEFNTDNPAPQLAVAEDFLVGFGLLAAGTSLRAAYLDFMAGQGAGYYSPERKELYVVSRTGGVGPTERATYAHEFTHQLQDQHFDLGALGLDVTDQGDRALARLALIEGDATAAQSMWLQSGALSPEELGVILLASVDPASLEVLRRAPPVLRETALFPYRDGFAFVTAIMANGGFGAVDAAYGRPPESSEQILHPEKYLAGEAPVTVEVPAGLADRLGGGWTAAAEDTLGEQFLRTWLREGGLEATEARAAAAGWGGDRAILLRGPGGARAIAFVTEWDDPAEAIEFAAAARTAIAGLGLTARIVQGAGSTRVAIAIGDHAVELAGALGS